MSTPLRPGQVYTGTTLLQVKKFCANRRLKIVSFGPVPYGSLYLSQGTNDDYLTVLARGALRLCVAAAYIPPGSRLVVKTLP